MLTNMRALLSGMARAGLMACISVSAAFAVAQVEPPTPITKETRETLIERMGAIVQKDAFVPGVDLSRWDDFLKKNREGIDLASTESDFAEAINRDLSKFFGVSHIVLITPRAAKARMERKAVGIGVSVQLEEGGLRVFTVFPDTPAHQAGIESGDLIFEADGKKLTSVTGMIGEEGSAVEIKLRRGEGEGEVKSFKLVRKKYSNVRPDKVAWPAPDTALVTIHTFDLAYDRKRVDDLMAEASKAPNLILDLRSNGGGVVLNMLHLLGHFLPHDTEIGTFVSRSMVNEFVKETSGKPTDLRAIAQWAEGRGLRPLKPKTEHYKGNVAVLVNGGTGSASEITAAALKEFREAPIVGTKSAGAVLVSTMKPLADGWLLQFPLMDYITSQGTRLEGTGVAPDVEAPTPRPKEPDVAIDKAIALLKRAELRSVREKPKPPTTPPPLVAV